MHNSGVNKIASRITVPTKTYKVYNSSMSINKLTIIVAFLVVFCFGIFLGFALKNSQNNGGSINLNPFPSSCQYNGKTYKSGDGFTAADGCNSCSCENGQVVCTLMACQ